MATVNEWTKDPAARLDWTAPWATWLADGETIDTSTWAVDAGDVVLDTPTFDGTTATVWVSGGTPGTTARFSNRIVTSAGRDDTRTGTLYVNDR